MPPVSLGKGQRYRWCFGGIQILRMHWRSMMPGRQNRANHLAAGHARQRSATAENACTFVATWDMSRLKNGDFLMTTDRSHGLPPQQRGQHNR